MFLRYCSVTALLFVSVSCTTVEVPEFGIGSYISAESTMMQKGQVHEHPDGEVRASSVPEGEPLEGQYVFSSGTVFFESDGDLARLRHESIQARIAQCIEPMLNYGTTGQRLNIRFTHHGDKFSEVSVSDGPMKRASPSACVQSVLSKHARNLQDGAYQQRVRVIQHPSILVARRPIH